jgi:hypothetical protein
MKLYWVTLALLLTLSACKADKEGHQNMSTKSEEHVTHCVGRNFIELPSSFIESSVTTGVFKLGELGNKGEPIDVVVRNGIFTSERFEAEMQKRNSELIKPHHGNVNVLRLDKKLSDGSNLFRVQEIGDSYVSEINILRGSTMVSLRLDSFHNKYIEAEEALIKLIAQIHAVDTMSPGKRNVGFCLGTVVLTANFSMESGSFLFRDGKGSSYGVEIDTFAQDAEPPLLTRMSEPNSLLTLFDVKHKVLRARECTAAGMQAQEWLGWAKVSDEPGQKTLKFALDTMRPKPSKATPSLRLTFDTAQPLEDGTPTQTLISDDEAIQQWDAVVDSIRTAAT